MKIENWLKRLLISSTFSQATMHVIRPYITYRAIEIGASPSAIGLIASSYALFPILFSIKFGKLVGKFGEGKFIALGGVFLIFSSAILLLAHNIYWLIFATGIAGLSHLALMIGGQTLVALRSPRKDHHRDFGYYTFSASLGQTFGPLIAGLIAGSIASGLPRHSNNAFIFAIFISCLALIPTLKWRKESPTVQVQESQSSIRAVINLLQDWKIAKAIFVSLSIATAGDLLVVFLPLLGKERMISPSFIGLMLALRAVGSMSSRLLLGRITKIINSERLVINSILISLLSFISMIFIQNDFILTMFVFLSGVALGFGQPITMAQISQYTIESERALAVSARLTGNRLGQFFVPLLAGLVATKSGATSVFWVLAGLLGLGLLAARSD